VDKAVPPDKSLLADLLKDGIGPTADAAPDASSSPVIKRTVFTQTATGSTHTFCGIPGSPTDPPAATLWEQVGTTYLMNRSVNITWSGAGCLKLNNLYAGRTYRLVTIY
jgi:hypothetical protein